MEKTYIYDVESIEKFKNLTKNDLKRYGNIIYDKKISVNGLNVYYMGINNTDQTENIFIITGKNKTCYMIIFTGNRGELLNKTKEIEKFISTIKVQ